MLGTASASRHPIGLLVSHVGERCGVHGFGRDLFKVLRAFETHRTDREPHLTWRYVECSSFDELSAAAQDLSPACTIFNHHPATMAWATAGGGNARLGLTFAVLHEVDQAIADVVSPHPFDYLLCPDPTLAPRAASVLAMERFHPPFSPLQEQPPPDVFTVGSFGFATAGKGFEKLCALVNAEFDEAVVKLNIPLHDNPLIASSDDILAVGEACGRNLTRRGVRLELTREFLPTQQLLEFLASNTINVFAYDDMPSRGISSCTDFAIASGRPLAVSRSSMFRHLHTIRPSLCFEDRTLADIAQDGPGVLDDVRSRAAPVVCGAAWTRAIEARVLGG